MRRLIVAVDKVRFVGETVAVVLADSPYIAQDAIELVAVDYEPLPVAASIEAALENDAVRIHEELGDNVLFYFETAAYDGPEDLGDYTGLGTILEF